MKTNYLNNFQLDADTEFKSYSGWFDKAKDFFNHESETDKTAQEFIDKILDERSETPKDKANRIGVPLIGNEEDYPEKKILDPNPIVGVCAKCGISIRQVMGYSCGRTNCPVQPKITL